MFIVYCNSIIIFYGILWRLNATIIDWNQGFYSLFKVDKEGGRSLREKNMYISFLHKLKDI
jgi:hypothetical protein